MRQRPSEALDLVVIMRFVGIVLVGLLLTGGALLAGGGAAPTTDAVAPMTPVVATPAAEGAGSDTGSAVVSVFDFGFRDSDTRSPVTHVGVGDTVTWVWDSGIHTVTEGVGDDVDVLPSAFDSGVKRPSDNDPTFSVTFDTTGAFVYLCEIHPLMRGTVVVA